MILGPKQENAGLSFSADLNEGIHLHVNIALYFPVVKILLMFNKIIKHCFIILLVND